MEEIRKMLGELDQQLDVELTQVNTRKINNEKIANENADKLVKRADDVLRMKKEALASLVDVAQKNYNDAETKKDVAKSALDTAQSRFTSASATFAAVSKTSVEDIARYDSEKESCESNAATIRIRILRASSSRRRRHWDTSRMSRKLSDRSVSSSKTSTLTSSSQIWERSPMQLPLSR